jgi:hypothetical protein
LRHDGLGAGGIVARADGGAGLRGAESQGLQGP